MKQPRITLKSALEGLLLTWSEWHAIVIGWGDGVSFTKTDWNEFYGVQPKYIEELIEELHYYKFGSALGRLTWALIIGSLLVRFLG